MNSTQGQIKPETLDLIERRAQRFGLSADEYLRSLISEGEELALGSDRSDAEFEADIEAFAEGTEELQPHRGIYSRDEIYSDHN